MKINEVISEAHPNSKVYDKCWKGYKKVPGKKRGEKGSCEKIKETTSAGAIAAVAQPLGGTISRNMGVYNKPKKKKKSKK